MLTIDSETHLIRKGLLAPPPICFSFAQAQTPGWLLDKERGATALEYALDGDEILLLHNGPFDLAVACAYRPHLVKKVFRHFDKGLVRDTKFTQQLIDIHNGMRRVKGASWALRRGEWVRPDYSLGGSKDVPGSKGLAYFYLGKDRSTDKADPDAWRLNYWQLDGMDTHRWPRKAREYAIEDAVDTLAVRAAQMADFRLQPEDLFVNELEQLQKAWVLHLISVWGVRSEREAVEKLEAYARDQYTALQKKMLAEGLFRLEKCSAADIREGKVDLHGPNPRRAKKAEIEAGRIDFWQKNEAGKDVAYVYDGQAAFRYVKDAEAVRLRVEAAYRAKGEEIPLTKPSEKFPAGQTKTDADVLEQSEDPLLEELSDNGPIATILKTFVPTLKRGTQVPINTRFNPILETGRISSSDPNLNNIPRNGGVRECIIARPGFVLGKADYDCAELRSHAQVNYWLFGESAMRDFFVANPKGDPHLDLAASILGISTDEAKARKKAGDEVVLDMRQMCKAINFGLPGGMGIKRLIDSARKQYGVILTEEEAWERKRQWLQRWPEMSRYFRYVSGLTTNGETSVEQLRPPGTGPHRHRGNVGYCDGCNGFFQALTADGAAHALWLVSKECYTDESSPLFGCRPVIFLYDEIILEIPEERGHEAANRLAELMVAGMQKWLPDVPVTAAPALMRRWYKKAEPVFVDGKLVPWEPVWLAS